MQIKAKESINASTFSQIWANLPTSQREELTLALYKAKACRTRQTIWKWATNQAKPINPIVKDAVAKVVSKTIGTHVLGSTLFPVD